MTPHFTAYILHILDSIERLESLLDRPSLSEDDIFFYNGVLRIIQTLSESACKLPEDIKDLYPHIKWRSFQITRNSLVHDYLGDFILSDVLKVVREDLPPLKVAMLNHIPNWEELRDEYKSETDKE